jgi:hypothetical protein
MRKLNYSDSNKLITAEINAINERQLALANVLRAALLFVDSSPAVSNCISSLEEFFPDLIPLSDELDYIPEVMGSGRPLIEVAVDGLE